ncbi:MAG: NYN domain-containing protein [Candidatus Jorgensenbacteria bacterium]
MADFRNFFHQPIVPAGRDWNQILEKLLEHLKMEWECGMIYFYAGIEGGDSEAIKEFDNLSKFEYATVRTKRIDIYKNPDRRIEIACAKCGENNVTVTDMGYTHKGNCDVDLTIDVLDLSCGGNEFFIFTGDGDFKPLVKKALDKGVSKVHIVSSDKTIMKVGIPYRRLATKLKALFKEFPNKVDLIDINSLKFKIKR